MAGAATLLSGVFSPASIRTPSIFFHHSHSLSRPRIFIPPGNVINPFNCRLSCYGSTRGAMFKVQALSAPSEDSVKKTISENPVVVFSKTWCSYSAEVKSLFKDLGVKPLVIELDQMGPDGNELQITLERLTGQRTVPNVFIGGKHIGGCTDTVQLHRKGELEPLLLEVGARPTKS
ncbi:monothiol glutaredoxin-S10-like [Impatiens glandulifera]|uniref:monothiol glutaredoxin-S10-like n=1 Tax=Impatiens glandulifera TaxID=253017 RepID=UPI001FB1077D|nr:monothiol glutaredoxin-S10-like [Impatiens glandulifera]